MGQSVTARRRSRPRGWRASSRKAALGPLEVAMCLGIPGKIIVIHDEQGIVMGTVDFGGVRRSVCLAYVAHDIAPGDYAIVHVGFAISKVSEEEAKRTYALLEEM